MGKRSRRSVSVLGKKLDQYHREKYNLECPELRAYCQKHISPTQMESINLDDHTKYLDRICRDKSRYPNGNFMSCQCLLQWLIDHDMGSKADWVWEVMSKCLTSHALQTMPQNLGGLAIEPQYFIRVIQKKNGGIIDQHDSRHREDQNIGLHDLMSQPSMCQVNTKQNVTVNRHTYLTEIDAGFCLFCNYHSSCHRTLNNHVQIHLRLPMFCGVGDCFFPTSDCKAMLAHVLEEHKDLGYLKSKKIAET